MLIEIPDQNTDCVLEAVQRRTELLRQCTNEMERNWERDLNRSEQILAAALTLHRYQDGSLGGES